MVGMLLLLYSYNFGTTLAISIGHSMDIGRYSMYQLAYTLLPQTVSLWLAMEAALALGAAWLARYRPVFAARPEPLPPPAPAAETMLAMGMLTPDAWPSGAGGDLWAEIAREEFVRVRFSAEGVPNADAAGMSGHVLLVYDGERTDARQIEAAAELGLSYRRAPADLIVYDSAERPRRFSWVGWLVRLAVGVDLSTDFSVPMLVSWRLYRQVAFTVLAVGRTTTGWLPEIVIQAVARGFVIRKLKLADAGIFDADALTPRPKAGAVWRLLWLCCRCRPWRCLGSLAAACLLCAAGFGVAAVHHPAHARHRYVVRRGPRRIAGAWSAAALASVATAGVLESRRRRWREVFLAGEVRTAQGALTH